MLSTISGSTAAECLQTLVRSILDGDALTARAAARDLVTHHLQDLPRPTDASALELTVAAAIVELLAERAHQPAPDWTSSVEAAREPLYLVEAASRFPNLRRQCEAESPAPLRRRNLFAPGNYLSWV
jgi:hypothetical protein